MDAAAIILAGVGGVVLVASVAGARRPHLPEAERAVFRAVNGLPGWLYWPLWVPMQFGNLVVGTAVGLLVAAFHSSGRAAVAAVLAAALKVVAERLVRDWTSGALAVRQRPGTSEQGAVLRGRDVPASGPSFPSGHVILAAAMACVLAEGLPLHWAWVAFGVTALVMVGRVYVGAHNPLDVTAGMGAGLLIGAIVAALLVR